MQVQRTRHPEVKGKVRVRHMNLQRSMVSLSEFENIARNRKLDVALIQEPYTRQGKVPSMGGFRMYYLSDPAAMVVVVNERVEALFIREPSSRHDVCVKLIFGKTECYVISSYFQYREDIGPHLQEWDRIINGIGTAAYVLAGDVNALSVLWIVRIQTDEVNNWKHLLWLTI